MFHDVPESDAVVRTHGCGLGQRMEDRLRMPVERPVDFDACRSPAGTGRRFEKITFSGTYVEHASGFAVSGVPTENAQAPPSAELPGERMTASVIARAVVILHACR